MLAVVSHLLCRWDTCRTTEEAMNVKSQLFVPLLQGITGIRFSGGEKCYIKTQVKARLPDVEALNKESMTFDLVGWSSQSYMSTHYDLTTREFISPFLLQEHDNPQLVSMERAPSVCFLCILQISLTS